jgi:hypothetical protein
MYGVFMAKNDMPRKSEELRELRIQITQMGDYYRDRLILDAATNGSTVASAVVGNCKASLDRKEAKIDQKIRWMADQRGVDFDDMTQQLLGRDAAAPSDAQQKLKKIALSLGLDSADELMTAIADGDIRVERQN